MQQWEYKLVTHETKKMHKDPAPLEAMSGALNDLGQQGWELVSVAPLSTTQGLDLGGSTKAYTFVLKRPVQGTS